MPHALLIGLAGGLASALIFASASAGGMGGRIILFFLAPLPCYLAALGWGVPAGAAGALTSAAGTGLLLGPQSGLVLLVSQGLPMIILCYLALLARAAPLMPGGASASPSPVVPALEWYPIGRLLAAATLIAAVLAAGAMLLLGSDLDQLRTVLRDLVEKVLIKQLPPLGKAGGGEADVAALTEMLLYAVPAGAAVMWLGGFVLNVWLGGRVTQISGRLLRPWPDIRLMRFPRGFGLGLLAALLSTTLPGLGGLIGIAIAGAFTFAHLLMGLAIIHYASQGMAARPFILWGVYLSLLVLNPWSGLVVALIAVLEPVLPWQRPPTAPSPSPPPPTT